MIRISLARQLGGWLLGAALLATANAPRTDPGWAVPVGAKLDGLTMLDGWTDPREVKGDVNTAGWPDSSYLFGSASKGYELHYSYSRYDFADRTLRHRLNDVGPVREGQVYPGFNLFKATIQDGAWKTERLPFNPSGKLDYAAGGMAASGSPYVYITFEPVKEGSLATTGNIYEVTRDASGRWGSPWKLPFPVNTPCVQDNPTLSADGLTMYFDSNREDLAGTKCLAGTSKPFVGPRSIFVTHFRDGTWSDPVAVGGAPNEHGPMNMQAFLSMDGKNLYWTGSREECPAINCFFRAERQPNGSFARLTMVALPTEVGPGMDGKVIALGESSVSADGKLLAFVYVKAGITGKDKPVVGPADKIEIGIGLARRKMAGE
jgi:hypothetical protein